MNFAISTRHMSKMKKKFAFYVAFLILVVTLSIFFISSDGFDWALYSVCLALMLLLIIWPRFQRIRKTFQNIREHRLITGPKGITLLSFGIEILIPWDTIDRVIVKRKRDGIGKFQISTVDAGKFDLAKYENTHDLLEEVNRYVDPTRL